MKHGLNILNTTGPHWGTAPLRRLLPLAREALIGLTFFVAVLFLRVPSFGLSVEDWDESVYLLVARAWLRGSLPYTRLWDHKPPGLYVLFLLTQWIFGQTVVSIRLLTCLTVGLSCYLIYRFGRDILRSIPTGLLAAVFYLAYSLKNEGVSGHPEILFNPFVILGFYLILRLSRREQATPWYLFGIGLIFGVAMQVKFTVLLDFAAAFGVYGLTTVVWRKWFSPRELWIHGVFIGIGFIIPLLAFLGLYTASGQLAAWIQANVTANSVYVQVTPFSIRLFVEALLAQIEGQLILWLALLLAPAYLLILARLQKNLDFKVLALLLWLTGSFVAVSLSKRYYLNYFLQMLPAQCLLTAYLIFSVSRAIKKTDRIWAYLLVVMLIGEALFEPLYMPLRTSLMDLRHPMKPDGPAIVAAYLREHSDHPTSLFVVDYQPIVYYLVDGVIPTRYIVPKVLTTEEWARVAGIDRFQELSSIMARKPQFVVLKDQVVADEFYAQLYTYLSLEYEKESAVGGAVIYRRLLDPPSGQ